MVKRLEICMFGLRLSLAVYQAGSFKIFLDSFSMDIDRDLLSGSCTDVLTALRRDLPEAACCQMILFNRKACLRKKSVPAQARYPDLPDTFQSCVIMILYTISSDSSREK